MHETPQYVTRLVADPVDTEGAIVLNGVSTQVIELKGFTTEGGPPAGLELMIGVPAGVDAEAAALELGELLWALSDLDIAWGGAGLAIHHREVETIDGRLKVVLRPLDGRWSEKRFTEMAELLGRMSAAGDAAEMPASTQVPEVFRQVLRSTRLPHETQRSVKELTMCVSGGRNLLISPRVLVSGGNPVSGGKA